LITVLVAGKLIKQPEKRLSQNGNPYLTAAIKTSSDPDVPLVSVVAFDESCCAALGALGKGDDVVISGRGNVTTWPKGDGTTAAGLNVVANVVLTSYGLAQKRKASRELALAGPPALTHPAFRNCGDNDADDEDNGALF
jgi:single-stranded DNA-binding protein